METKKQMMDLSYIAAHKNELEFQISDRRGTWKYNRAYGDARSMRYVFSRPDFRGCLRNIEVSLSYQQVQDKVSLLNGSHPEFKITNEMLQAPLQLYPARRNAFFLSQA